MLGRARSRALPESQAGPHTNGYCNDILRLECGPQLLFRSPLAQHQYYKIVRDERKVDNRGPVRYTLLITLRNMSLQ